ncbi:hypothetical protein GRX66_04260, partial [Halobacterium sp. PCN9]|nr:hypothetical protein [Halobacterium bonnevillei]
MPDADHDDSGTDSERHSAGDRTRATIAFSDLAVAVYCPRQLYYARRDDRDPPAEHRHARELA